MISKFTVALAALALQTYAQDSTFVQRLLEGEEIAIDDPDEEPTSPTRLPYYETAQTPDDVGWFKGSTYKSKSRYDKMIDLWDQVTKDTSGPREPYWKEFSRTFSQDAPHALCQESDEIKRGRLKVFHTQGVVAKVKYVPEPENGLSGMLGEGSDTVLLRFSESANLHEESEGLTPSMAIKFLRDGTFSSNIVA